MARDLSVITTPPPNRYPIETQVIRFNEEVIHAMRFHMKFNVVDKSISSTNELENIKEVPE